MKYLLIFLPIFCFAQGGDSTLYGTRIDIDSFGTTSHPDTCWEIKNGWMSLKPGCTLAEYNATKFYGYNYYDDQFFMSGGAVKRVQKDLIVWYLAGDKRIKSSHVIKEL